MKVSAIARCMLVVATGGLLLATTADVAWGQCETTESAQVMASDWARYRHLGRAVSISGDTAVAGAHPEASETSAPGWAYVYDYIEAGTWNEAAIVTGSDVLDGDKFGAAVAISGDTMVAGAYQHDIDYGNCGAAYVFERNEGGTDNWGQVAKLMASDAEGSDNLGYAVAIDGDTIVVGARNEDVEGAAYVFVKPSTGWTDTFETAKLKAANPVRNEKFGAAVAISGDTILIGDYNQDGIGAAYIFEKPDGGWVSMTQTAKLTPSDGASSDQFALSVAIDGDVAVAGSPKNDGAGSDAGAAYIYHKPDTGWVDMTETQKLTAASAVDSENFGTSVSIDDELMLIGLPQHWSADIGAGVVCTWDGAAWVEQGRMLPSDGETYDYYAQTVGISGNKAVIGAMDWDYDDGGVPGRVVGAMYVFEYLADCNSNGMLDICDIADGTLHDDDLDGVPDECECWGDLDGDSDIDLTDLAQLLSNYGMTSGAVYEDGDLDGDGDVDLSDLATLLSVYGTSC